MLDYVGEIIGEEGEKRFYRMKELERKEHVGVFCK